MNMTAPPMSIMYVKRWSDEHLDDMFRDVNHGGGGVMSIPITSFSFNGDSLIRHQYGRAS